MHSISKNMAIVISVSTSIASTGASTLQKCFRAYVLLLPLRAKDLKNGFAWRLRMISTNQVIL